MALLLLILACLGLGFWAGIVAEDIHHQRNKQK